MNTMKKINLIKKVKAFFRISLISIVLIISGSQTACADEIASSKFATGTQKLISDATNWLMILAPVVTVLCIIYFLIRKSISDEMEHKKWNTRIAVALVSCVGAVLSAVIVNVLVSYYK